MLDRARPIMRTYQFRVDRIERFGKLDFFKLVTSDGRKHVYVATSLMPGTRVGDLVTRETLVDWGF